MNVIRTTIRVLSVSTILLTVALGYSCATIGDSEKAIEGKPAAPAKQAEASAKPAVKPQVLPTPPKLTPVVMTTTPAEPVQKRLKRAPKPTQQEAQAVQAARVTRSVAAAVLNIRAKPSTDAAVVGKLIKGSQLPVEIKGEWAKIGEDQYVQTKFLTSK